MKSSVRSHLQMKRASASNTVAIYHGLIGLSYITPLIGSILADGYIGCFRTILWINLLYATGTVALAVVAGFDKESPIHPGLDLFSLTVIAFGSGGIKACFSAFGGDQFNKGQARFLKTYFFVIYFSINAATMISYFITPYLRGKSRLLSFLLSILNVMSCLGQDSCYSLAFGLPAALLVVSVVIFAIGSRWYIKYPPKENVIVEMITLMKSALSNRRFFNITHDHWLDHHLDNHSCAKDLKCLEYSRKQTSKGRDGTCFQAQFVADVKAFLRILVLYLPVPIFWALFDLQGSRWVLQGTAMDSLLWKDVVLLPDQMPTFNAILAMIFIPVFKGVIYPTVKKCGINPTPLRKMTVGGIFASTSFIVAMAVQFGVNETLPTIPAKDEVQLAFINLHNCAANVTPITRVNGVSGMHSIPIGGSLKLKGIIMNDKQWTTFNWSVSSRCFRARTVQTAVQAGKPFYTAISSDGDGTYEADLKKPATGEGQFKISPRDDHIHPCAPNDNDNFQPIQITTFGTSWFDESAFVELKPREWLLYRVNNTDIWKDKQTSKQQLSPYLVPTNVSVSISCQGGIYTLTVDSTGQNQYTIVPCNKVSILWQIPQYVFITAGEILFCITGLEFSYSQAPNSMKSVIQGAWLLTVAGGGLIDLVIAKLQIFTNLAWEFLLDACLMAVMIFIFAMMSQFWYVYVNYERDDEEAENCDSETTT